MPPKDWLRHFIDTACGTLSRIDLFSTLDDKNYANMPTQDCQYSVSSRVHALNVLRMIVLDAPLSKDIQPYIGDAITAAIVGYVDPEWGVRNSSTMVFAACLLRAVDADKNAANSESKSSNAITIAELFRLYPNLPDFLSAVLAGSLSGKVQVAGGVPLILPILILLYRVQPSSASDLDSVKRFDCFVPHVTECLGHRHLAIRKAASRALGNMCSSNRQSPTYFGCILKQAFDAVMRKDCWNYVHGSLLVINEIFQTNGVAKEDCWIQLLFATIPLSGGCQIPPICSAEALQALHALSRDDSDLSHKLLAACFTTLSSACRTRPLATFMIGLAELSRVASSIATTIVLQRMLSSVQELRNVADDDATNLAYLLQCSHFDARNAAVKVCKKAVYDLVDKALFTSKRNGDVAGRTLQQLREIVLSALASEVARGSQSGLPHPPTLRRLSRCLLECVEAERKVRPQQLDGTIGNMGETLLRLGQRDTGIIGATSYNDEENTSGLLGNAAELLSWNPRPSQLDELIDLVQRLSAPTVSWRLRWSAAVGVKLLLSADSLPEKEKAKIWCTGSMLLQDSDADVRFVACQAMSCCRGHDSPLLVPERTLIDFRDSTILPVQFALYKLHQLGRDTVNKARTMSIQLLDIFRNGRGENIPNVGTDRKIFEQEAPNTYVELALDYQVTLRMMMFQHHAESIRTIENQELAFAAQECLGFCNNVALSLLELPEVIVGEMTRSNTLFPELHCLLLGCAGLVYMGIVESAMISSSDLASLCRFEDCHPLIQDASQVLVSARENDASTFKSVICSCFLLH